MKYIQLTWSNWGDVCTLVEMDNFISGVYLDDKTKEPLSKPFENIGGSSDTIGCYLKIDNKIVLAKENEYLVYKDGNLSVWGQKRFEREQKLEKIKNINGN